MDLGEEQGDAQTKVGDPVAVTVRDALDEAVQAQPTQVIGHASRGIGLDGKRERLCHPGTHGGVTESLGKAQEQTQDLQQREHPGIVEAQAGGALAVDDLSQL